MLLDEHVPVLLGLLGCACVPEHTSRLFTEGGESLGARFGVDVRKLNSSDGGNIVSGADGCSYLGSKRHGVEGLISTCIRKRK